MTQFDQMTRENAALVPKSAEVAESLIGQDARLEYLIKDSHIYFALD